MRADRSERSHGLPQGEPERLTSEFLSLLTEAERADLMRRGRRRQWERDETVCTEGERTDWVLVLLSGWAKVSSATARGSEVLLAVRGPGALLGELAAIDHQPRSATVTALERLTALVVPVAEFTAHLEANGRVSFLLMRLLTERLRDADRKRIEFGAHSTTGRVATRLVELAERFGQRTATGLRVAVPLSQDELAGWTGASREAVSKALGVLRAYGWISTGRRQIVVHDLEALRSLTS
ncbi:Crp/Fnr family transcriptional regulator [Pseudonocardia sp.]|uniref:Crp/Fnr family transcriptional regulator n=1 Tax=Pseudonocardia sp. TaxID=60912 RepID=UPI002EDB8429